MQILGVIPARGGSKGIPGKNLVLLQGRPLLAYTCDAARASRLLTRVVLTTDSDEIAAAARANGVEVPFMRPAALAADGTPMMDVLLHTIEQVERPDVLVLLQPTSPLRRGEHVDAAISLLLATGADTVVSVVEVPHQFTPGSVLHLDGDRVRPFMEGPSVTLRQEKPRLYARNGPAVLVTRTAVVESRRLYGDDTRAYVMAREESVDIDDRFDLVVADALLARRSAAAAR